MVRISDLTDPRYLDEVGWFLYHEKYGRTQFGGSYTAERLAYSRSLLDEVLDYCGQDRQWLADKTVVSVGCGCTGDLCTWPAAVKIAVDPLLYVYQQLGMLLEDVAGTSRTVYLAIGVEELPLLDECADVVVCRNALDHTPDPQRSLQQIARILKRQGLLFVSVDLGGSPTADEPTVFTAESLRAFLLHEPFEILTQTSHHPPHSKGRICSVRLVARKQPRDRPALDKDTILRAYVARFTEQESTQADSAATGSASAPRS
jgi:SAM-dependent methyltransferase